LGNAYSSLSKRVDNSTYIEDKCNSNNIIMQLIIICLILFMILKVTTSLIYNNKPINRLLLRIRMASTDTTTLQTLKVISFIV